MCHLKRNTPSCSLLSLISLLFDFIFSLCCLNHLQQVLHAPLSLLRLHLIWAPSYSKYCRCWHRDIKADLLIQTPPNTQHHSSAQDTQQLNLHMCSSKYLRCEIRAFSVGISWKTHFIYEEKLHQIIFLIFLLKQMLQSEYLQHQTWSPEQLLSQFLGLDTIFSRP